MALAAAFSPNACHRFSTKSLDFQTNMDPLYAAVAAAPCAPAAQCVAAEDGRERRRALRRRAAHPTAASLGSFRRRDARQGGGSGFWQQSRSSRVVLAIAVDLAVAAAACRPRAPARPAQQPGPRQARAPERVAAAARVDRVVGAMEGGRRRLEVGEQPLLAVAEEEEVDYEEEDGKITKKLILGWDALDQSWKLAM